MEVSKTRIYITTITAPKGKKFSEDLIRSANLLNDDELETLRVMLSGHVIRWESTINFEAIPGAKYIGWFTPTLIDAA